MTIFLRGLLFFALIIKNFDLTAERPVVLVTVAPHKFFVEKIAKETVNAYLMVPAGASSHTFEPTPRQMVTAGQGVIWFRIGEPFENRALQALTSHNPHLKIVDLREGLDLIQAHGGCCPGSVDLHFWLSARQGEIQAKTIADALIKAFPDKSNFYKKNLELFIQELRDLDQKIQKILDPVKKRFMLASHPAFAYFCRDYGFVQYSIEVEGKDPTPQQLTKLLSLARQLEIKKIFIQMQYSNKAAKLVAETIGAKLVVVDPYSEHYFASMEEIAHAIADE